MKRKLFSILTLLAVSVFGGGSVWAETIFSANALGSAAVSFEPGTTAITSEMAAISGGTMSAISAQTSAKNLIGLQGGNPYFCMTNNNTSFKVTLTKALAIGDTISAITFSRTDTGLGLYISISTSYASCDEKLHLDAVEKAAREPFSSYVVKEGDKLVGVNEFYIYRETGKSTYFTAFTITRPHIHSYATAWTSDANGHWHACTASGDCDAPKADSTAHAFGEVGEALYTCSVCGYVDEAKKTAASSQDAVNAVISKIDAIGVVAYTPACKALIDDARSAYDALTVDQKQGVTNYETLTAAEDAYKKLAEAAGNADYTVTIKDGTDDAENWVITPDTGKPGTIVTIKYKGAKQIKSIKIRKKAAVVSE